MSDIYRIVQQLTFSRAILPTLGGPAFVLIYGSVNYDHGDYFVATTAYNGWPAAPMMNGVSPWISLNEVIYFGEVDDEFVLQNMIGGDWLDISSVVYMTASRYDLSLKIITEAIADIQI